MRVVLILSLALVVREELSYFSRGNVLLLCFGVDRHQDDSAFQCALIDDSVTTALPLAAIRIPHPNFVYFIENAGDLIAGCLSQNQGIQERLNVCFYLSIPLRQLAEVTFEFRRV